MTKAILKIDATLEQFYKEHLCYFLTLGLTKWFEEIRSMNVPHGKPLISKWSIEVVELEEPT